MKIYTDLHSRTSLYNIPSWGIDKIESMGANLIHDYDETATIYFGDLLEKEDIENLPNLKWIHFPSVGVNRALIPEVINSDIIVTNSKGIFDKSVSSMALSYIIYFSKGFHQIQKLRSEHRLDRENFEGYIPNLKEPFFGGLKCLIVGHGNIGNELSKICSYLGIRVDSVRSQDNIKECIKKSQSDFVINLLPLTPKTDSVFDYETFECMKSDSYFLNLGRGQSVIEGDLIDALKHKVIAGAGLDVFRIEPLPLDSELWELDNVLITPHIANLDKNYWKNEISLFIDNLKRFSNNYDLRNVINLERGY